MRRIQASIQRALSQNADLLGWWLVLLVYQHMLPPTDPMARDDLLPWMMLTLSGAAFLRARRFGMGPHPMLTPRVDFVNSLLQRAAAALAPWAFMYIYYTAWERSTEHLAWAGGAAGAVVLLTVMGGNHGRTAWNPDRSSNLPIVLRWSFIFVTVAALVGLQAGVSPKNPFTQAGARSILVGLAFLSIGMMSARVQNHRQRQAAGRKDGKPYRQLMFPATLATGGPAVSLGVVLVVVQGLDFGQAFVVALLVVVWAGVVWPKPSPVMVSCVLHEVIPVGGADPVPQTGQANAFDVPPEGALRFNPLATKRTLVQHPWVVPVRSSRIAELDDPIRPLWELPAPLLPDHILGDAAFEPDPITRGDQWEVITIRLAGRDDTADLASGDGGARRMVILRAFPAPGESPRARMATYRWEEDVPEDTMQVLDLTTETATLRDGDMLVLSSEGVAKAFEIEIGAPIYRVADANLFRPPQLEDYVVLG